MKAGPIVAMLALVFVGVWLVLQPTLAKEDRIDPASHRFVLELGAREVTVEQRPAPTGGYEYALAGDPDQTTLGWIDEAAFAELVAERMTAWEARPAFERGTLGFFNITSWGNLIWVLVGLGGQGAFFGRMMVQWVISEKSRASVVPEMFWWLSLFGGLSLFTYFVWRTDIVGVLGQSTGIVIYARNLRLIGKQRRRDARKSADAPTPTPAEDRREAVHAGAA